MRYELHLEVRPALDPKVDFADEGSDHLLELHELLGQIEHPLPSGSATADQLPKQHFDLCPQCYQQFVKNPLGRAAQVMLGFSNN